VGAGRVLLEMRVSVRLLSEDKFVGEGKVLDDVVRLGESGCRYVKTSFNTHTHTLTDMIFFVS
jgi:hypothetical protein